MNYREKTVLKQLEAQGYEVFDRGWPDFLVRHRITGEVKAVEVKATTDSVRPEQERMHTVLADRGIPTEVVRVKTPNYRKEEQISIIRKMMEDNYLVSTNEIYRETGISQNRAWQVMKEIRRGHN